MRQGGGYFYDCTWCPGLRLRRSKDITKHVYASIDSITSGTPFFTIKQACDMFESQGHPTLQSDPQARSGYCHSLGMALVCRCIGLSHGEKPGSELKPDLFSRSNQVMPGEELWHPHREHSTSMPPENLKCSLFG